MDHGFARRSIGGNLTRREVMHMEEIILQVLRDVGIYERARRLVSSDSELVELFVNRFDELIAKVGG